jgi:hypothetical protein
MPWHQISGVQNKSISRALEKRDRAELETLSRAFSLEFLLGVINSSWMSEYIRNHRRDRTNLYPDDFKRVPIPNVSKVKQKPVEEKIKAIVALSYEFYSLRRIDWTLNTERISVEAPVKFPSSISKLNIKNAKVRWSMTIKQSDADITALKLKGTSLFRGKAEIIALPGGTSAKALEWLRRQFSALGEGTTFQMAEASGLDIPASPADAEKALEALEKQEAEVRAKIEEFHKLRKDVDDLVAALYVPS